MMTRNRKAIAVWVPNRQYLWLRGSREMLRCRPRRERLLERGLQALLRMDKRVALGALAPLAGKAAGGVEAHIGNENRMRFLPALLV